MFNKSPMRYIWNKTVDLLWILVALIFGSLIMLLFYSDFLLILLFRIGAAR